MATANSVMSMRRAVSHMISLEMGPSLGSSANHHRVIINLILVINVEFRSVNSKPPLRCGTHDPILRSRTDPLKEVEIVMLEFFQELRFMESVKRRVPQHSP